MHYRDEKIWLHFPQDIIASGGNEASYLAWFLRWTYVSRTYLRCLEVIDLQRYRLVTRKNKIYSIIRDDRADQAFIFIVNKN